MNLCLCGCGEKVTKIKNKYLVGHNQRGKKRPKYEKLKIAKSMKKYLTNPKAKEQRAAIWRGRTHTEETKKKLSQLHSGKNNPMYGKSLSTAHKIKLSKALKGRIFSKETKLKLSEASKGKIITQEQRENISNTLKKYYKENQNPFKNKKHTKKSKEKMSKSLKGIYINEKASNWHRGISRLPYSPEWDKRLRFKIKKRDNNTC